MDGFVFVLETLNYRMNINYKRIKIKLPEFYLPKDNMVFRLKTQAAEKEPEIANNLVEGICYLERVIISWNLDRNFHISTMYKFYDGNDYEFWSTINNLDPVDNLKTVKEKELYLPGYHDKYVIETKFGRQEFNVKSTKIELIFSNMPFSPPFMMCLPCYEGELYFNSRGDLLLKPNEKLVCVYQE